MSNLKIYKVTTITDYSNKHIKTVAADSKYEAIIKASAALAKDEYIAAVEEV